MSTSPTPPVGPSYRLSVQAWFYLVLAIMVILVTVGGFVGSSLLHTTNVAANRLIEHIQPAQTAAKTLQSSLINQETGVRGYALTADKQFLAPFTQGVRDEAAAAARIRRLVGDEKEALAELDRLQDAAARWRTDFAQPLIDTVVEGSDTSLNRSATKAKVAFDQIRGLFGTQNATLAQLHDESLDDLHQSRDQRSWVLLAMVGLFLATALVMLGLVRLVVLRPLGLLKSSALNVAAGEFDRPIQENGPADLRELARAVEDMRHRVIADLKVSDAQRAQLTVQAADLDEQAIELRRSNAELEQFAYVASHDLQEPLRKVASFCQLLEKRYADQLDERGLQYIEFAVDGAKRMQVLINDLLTFSRVGRTNDNDEIVSLDAALDEALGSLSTTVEESGATILRPETLPEVRADRTLMVMLWQNLIGNAMKFRTEGVDPRIEIECVLDETGTSPYWSFAVTDNGIGIAPEFADKVFVIFQRLHARDAYTGTGIGLALCKKVVDYFGGRIWLDPAHTTGARICFTLPVATPVPSPTTTLPSAEGTTP